MLTRIASSTLLGLILAAFPALAADPPKPTDSGAIAAKLAKRADIDKLIDASLGDVLAYLSDRFEMNFLIDQSLKSDIALEDRESTKIRLMKLPGVRLDTVLKQVTDQLNATYLVYPDHIRIVSIPQMIRETGQKADDDNEGIDLAAFVRHKPLVHLALDGKPLDAALKEVADATGANIVLAPHAKDKGRAPITVKMTNVPVDAAVRTLADMADLKMTVQANVYYVTTKERVEAEEAKLERKREKQLSQLGGLGGPGVGLPLGFVPPADSAHLLERLKKIEEQLEKLSKKP